MCSFITRILLTRGRAHAHTHVYVCVYSYYHMCKLCSMHTLTISLCMCIEVGRSRITQFTFDIIIYKLSIYVGQTCVSLCFSHTVSFLSVCQSFAHFHALGRTDAHTHIIHKSRNYTIYMNLHELSTDKKQMMS